MFCTYDRGMVMKKVRTQKGFWGWLWGSGWGASGSGG